MFRKKSIIGITPITQGIIFVREMIVIWIVLSGLNIFIYIFQYTSRFKFNFIDPAFLIIRPLRFSSTNHQSIVSSFFSSTNSLLYINTSVLEKFLLKTNSFTFTVFFLVPKHFSFLEKFKISKIYRDKRKH